MAPRVVLPRLRNVRLADMNVDIAHDIAVARRIEAVTAFPSWLGPYHHCAA